jgi:hypothetical protein
MTTLIISPILAVTVAAEAQSHPATSAAPTSVHTVSRIQGITPLKVSELRDAQTDAPSAGPVPARVPVAKPPVTIRRPARVRVAVPPAANPNSVVGIIEAAAARWGVSGSRMVSIARCESGLRTNAYNPSGPYIGLFQFLQSTFTANGGTNIYSATDQSNIAAKMLAHGQAHQWSCA